MFDRIISIMRIEATIPNTTGAQLDQLATELGVSRSQVVEEALALLTRAAIEARRGRRMAIVEVETQRTVCELVSPILSQLEWAAHRERLVLPAKAVEEMAKIMRRPPAPTPALRKLMGKRKR